MRSQTTFSADISAGCTNTDVYPQQVKKTLVVSLDGSRLRIQDVISVAAQFAEVRLNATARANINASRHVLESCAASGQPIYGMNTYLGPFIESPMGDVDLSQFQRTTVLGHAVRQGTQLTATQVRAMMLARLNGFALGTSGIRLETAQRLCDLLNKRVHPIVRTGASSGASDLSDMSQIAMVLLGLGEAEFEGVEMSGAEALARAGMQPLKLAGKEGLSLINHNGFTIGAGTLVLNAALLTLSAFNVAAAFSLESFAGNLSMLHPAASRNKPHSGYLKVSHKLRKILAGSYLWQKDAARNLQDPLSFRCIPLVHGAVYEAVERLRNVLEIELNSGGDNPLVSIEDECVVSVGNFDTTNIAIAFDSLRIALGHLITMSNERIQKQLWHEFSGLPAGLNKVSTGFTGLIPLARAVAAMTAEARNLANPVSLDFRTQLGEGVEDYASMAPLAVSQTERMLEIANSVAAVEMLIASSALTLRGSAKLGKHTRAAHDLIGLDQPVSPVNWDAKLTRLRKAISAGRFIV